MLSFSNPTLFTFTEPTAVKSELGAGMRQGFINYPGRTDLVDQLRQSRTPFGVSKFRDVASVTSEGLTFSYESPDEETSQWFADFDNHMIETAWRNKWLKFKSHTRDAYAASYKSCLKQSDEYRDYLRFRVDFRPMINDRPNNSMCKISRIHITPSQVWGTAGEFNDIRPGCTILIRIRLCRYWITSTNQYGPKIAVTEIGVVMPANKPVTSLANPDGTPIEFVDEETSNKRLKTTPDTGEEEEAAGEADPMEPTGTEHAQAMSDEFGGF